MSKVKINPLYLVLGTFIMIALTLSFNTNKVSAHGYVDNPKSRAVLCAEGVNKDCGGVVYEPQSIEGPGNYPEAGVPDGKIASGGGVFPELDEQGENRWAKVGMSSGAYTFHWTLTAAHATSNWDYYITKEGWDPNTPLKRSDFELFCSIDDGGKRPDFSVSHDCVIPERSGYHVILAYWEVADTANAFYQVIDANFDGDFVEPVDPPGDGDDGNDNDGENPALPTWDSETVYLANDEVTYNGNVYRAKWWTQGDNPESSNAWELISEGDNESGDNGNGDEGNNPEVPAWDSTTVYLAHDEVTYNGNVYRAKWWTQGDTPGDSGVWELVS